MSGIPSVTCGASVTLSFSAGTQSQVLSATATNTPIAWAWLLLSVPTGSTAMSQTRGDFINGVATVQNPTFVTDAGLGGTYVIQCVATNSAGPSNPDVDKGSCQQNITVQTALLGLRVPNDYQWNWGQPLNYTIDLLEDNSAAARSVIAGTNLTGGGALSSNVTLNLNPIPSGIDALRFDTSAVLTHSPGQLHWNSTDGTLNIDTEFADVAIQVGQESVIKCVNKTNTTILNGDVVYVFGAQGQRPAVYFADNDAESTSHSTIGLATHTFIKNTEGLITTFGLVRDLNTTGSLVGETWNDGDVLYLSSTAGKLTNIEPVAPKHRVIVGIVLNTHINAGVIFVNVQGGEELEELHNVSISSVQNNDILKYNSATALWVNSPASGIVSSLNHNLLTNLTVGDVHTQYGLLAGRSGGQTFSGGTGSTDALTLQATTNVGGTTGADIIFKTGAGAETLRITSDQRLWLGSGTPKLLCMPSYVGNAEAPAGVLLSNYDSNLVLFPEAHYGSAGYGLVFAYTSLGAVKSAIEYFNPATGFADLKLMKSGGNVGIGTGATAPGAPLDVRGEARFNSTVRFTRADADIAHNFFFKSWATGDASNYGNPLGNGAGEISSAGQAGLIIGTYAGGGPLVFGTNNVERVRIDSTGNVGVLKTPTTPLDVNGTITASGLVLCPTTSSSTGVIYKSVNRFIHDYNGTNLFVGINAGNFTMEATTGVNVGIGTEALSSLVNTNANTAVGYQALKSTGYSGYNTAVGTWAGTTLNGGGYNVFLGASAGYAATSTASSVAIGYNTLSTGTNNTGCVAVGNQAGQNATGTYNVFLGYGAGYNEVGHNKLYISNSTTATPLIYGDFSAPSVTINGSLTVTGGVTGYILNPMTNLGDIIYGGASGTPTRLGAGVEGQVLHGGATPTWDYITEAHLTFSNNTTANASATKHGLMPILSNVPSEFMNGQGNWATPAGVTTSYTTQSFTSQTTVVCAHGFGVYPVVQIIDNTGAVIIPQSITNTTVNSFTVVFASSTTGTILATVGSPQAQAVRSVSDDYTTLITDRIIKVLTSGKTITLITAVGNSGKEYVIDNASAGNITLEGNLSETIEGELNQAIPMNCAIHVYSDGSNWRIY